MASRPIDSGFSAGGARASDTADDGERSAGPAQGARRTAWPSSRAEPDWRIVETGVDDLWQTVVDGADGATYFHTPGWADVVERTFPRWRRMPLVLEFSDGNAAVVPLMARRGPLPGTGHVESMLPGVYGGPLFLRAPAEAHWRAVWRALDGFADLFLYGNPFLEWQGLPSGQRVVEWTRAIDLGPGEEAVHGAFRYSFRWGMRKAAREYEVGLARSGADVDEYAALYRQSLKRWGRTASGHYPARLFENLLAVGQDDSIRLWVARRDGHVVAGAWMLYHGRHVDYWHGAVDANEMARYPAHLAISEAIRDAGRSGYRWFDFNPSGGLEGVDAFKRGFGAERREFPVLTRFRPACRAYRRYRRFLEKHARRCPL